MKVCFNAKGEKRMNEYGSLGNASEITKSDYVMLGYLPRIDNVIFNNPATIVFWSDGSKTVVKCQEGDEFDPEKGLCMAIAKKSFGNKGKYYNKIKKWTDTYTGTSIATCIDFTNTLTEAINDFIASICPTIPKGDKE